MQCLKLLVTATLLLLVFSNNSFPCRAERVRERDDDDNTANGESMQSRNKRMAEEEDPMEHTSDWYHNELSSHLENGLLVLNDGAFLLFVASCFVGLSHEFHSLDRNQYI